MIDECQERAFHGIAYKMHIISRRNNFCQTQFFGELPFTAGLYRISRNHGSQAEGLPGMYQKILLIEPMLTCEVPCGRFRLHGINSLWIRSWCYCFSVSRFYSPA